MTHHRSQIAVGARAFPGPAADRRAAASVGGGVRRAAGDTRGDEQGRHGGIELLGLGR